MFYKITIVALLLPLITMSQLSPVASCPKQSGKNVISGKLQSTHFSQGGIQRLDENIVPVPMANYTMLVVRIENSENVPEVVGKIKTDSQGNFTIKLPYGKYGFVREQDRNNLSLGQCLPGFEQSGDIEQSYSSGWQSSIVCPIDITQNSVTDVVITNHQRSICGVCP